MTLADRDPARAARRRDRLMAATEQTMVEVTSDAVRTFLERLVDAVTGDALTAAAALPAMPTLGRVMGWWDDATVPVAEQAAEAFRRGWGDTSDLLVPQEDVAVYMQSVRDRLVYGAGVSPPLAADAFDTVRTVIADSVNNGDPIGGLSARLAAELGWSPDGPYWQGQHDAYGSALDDLLDGYGPPGTAAREAARAGGDPTVDLLQRRRADARLHLDRDRTVWQTRAERIARTETTGAVNAGAVRAGVAEGAGVKVWLATYDSRTRPEHVAANGQCVPIDGMFDVGGVGMSKPGDPNAPAGLVVNCRCTVLMADDCDEAASLFGDVVDVDEGLPATPPPDLDDDRPEWVRDLDDAYADLPSDPSQIGLDPDGRVDLDVNARGRVRAVGPVLARQEAAVRRIGAGVEARARELAGDVDLPALLAEQARRTAERQSLFDAWRTMPFGPERDALYARIGALAPDSVLAGQIAAARLAMGQARLAALAELRDFGGTLTFRQLKIKGFASNGTGERAVANAAAYYPSDWIEASNAAGSLSARTARSRAYHARLNDGSGAVMSVPSSSNPNAARVAAHELGHQMEATRPQLGRLEAAFHERRTGAVTDARPLADVGPHYAHYSRSEVGREDEYANAYTGREYDGWLRRMMQGDAAHFEIFSTGVEGTLFDADYADPDMVDFILGLLAAA